MNNQCLPQLSSMQTLKLMSRIKSTTCSFVLLFILLIPALSFSQGTAKSHTTPGKWLIVENFEFPLAVCATTDSVINGRVNFAASLEFNLTSEIGIMMVFLQQFVGKAFPKMTIRTMDFDGQPKEDMVYTSVLITDLSISELDAGSRDLAKVQVRFNSNTATLLKASAGQKQTSFTPGKAVLASNFRVTIGNLPTSRVSLVGDLTIQSNEVFKVQISAAEEEEWRTLFYKGQTQGMSGKIELMSPNLRDVILVFNLTGLELLSMTKQTISNSALVSRFTVLFRAKNITLSQK